MDNSARRRRLALVALVSSTALTAGALVALAPGPVQAAPVRTANPPAVASTSGPVDVTFTTTSPFAPSGQPVPPLGTQVELVRSGTSGTEGEDTIVGDVVEADLPVPGDRITARFTFAGTPDAAPPNPGSYDVFVYVQDRRTGDACVRCFSVFSPAPTVTAVNVPALPNGTEGQTFTVTGTGFAKDTTVQAVFPGTDRVDPSISFAPALSAAGAFGGGSPVPNTATTLSRTVRVDPTASPGVRDLLVHNTDADLESGVGTGRLAGGFRVLDVDVDRVTPTAAGNDQSVLVAVLGRGLPAGATVRLVNEAAPTVGTLTGTGTRRLSAERLSTRFDLTDALPGTYRVQVSVGDDSSAPECSPTFEVVDVGSSPRSGRAATRVSEYTCGVASASTPGPTPSATPTASTSPPPSGSAAPSASATPSRSPDRSAGSTRRAALAVSPTTITAQGQALVRGTATPGSVVELLAYSRPSTTYAVVRRGVVGQSGTLDFRVAPSGNTRMFLRASDGDGADTVDSASTVLRVRTSLTLEVTRVGPRTYRFAGRALPARRGQLVQVSRTDPGGERVLVTRARVDSRGAYDVSRRFTGGGTFTFSSGTGTDNDNLGGTSPPVRVRIR